MGTEFSVILYYLTFFVLSIYILFLLHKGNKKPSNFVLAIFFLSQGLGITPNLFFNYYDYFYQHAPNLFFIALPFCLLWAPSMFLYVKSITQKEFWKDWRHLLHFIPFITLYLHLIFNFFIYDLSGKQSIMDKGGPMPYEYFEILMAVIFIQVVVYNTASIWTLNRYKKQHQTHLDQKEYKSLRWLEYIVYGYVIVCFLNTGVIKGINLFYDLNEQNVGLASFLIFFTVLFYYALIRPQVFVPEEEKPKYQYSQLDEQSARNLCEKLDQYIESEKPYLKPNISLKELAEDLNISSRHLSQIINDQKGQNFYDFINARRIKEAEKLLSDPHNDLNILQILYEVGFNSKTSFNVTFKKHTGMTPTQYRNKFSNASKLG